MYRGKPDSSHGWRYPAIEVGAEQTPGGVHSSRSFTRRHRTTFDLLHPFLQKWVQDVVVWAIRVGGNETSGVTVACSAASNHTRPNTARRGITSGPIAVQKKGRAHSWAIGAPCIRSEDNQKAPSVRRQRQEKPQSTRLD